MRMKPIFVATVLSVLAVIASAGAYAQEEEHHESSNHSSGHHAHKNVVSVFTGVTHAGRRKNGFALGAAYERLFTDRFSIGVLAEHTFGDADFTVYAVPIAYRFDRWKFYVAPGIEDSAKHGTESLVRVAGEYAFMAGSLEISPQVAVDFVGSDQVLVIGVVFGKGF